MVIPAESDSRDKAAFFPELGLYRRRYESDACGVGLVAQIDGGASHQIVKQGLEILRRLEHRGAIGGDGCTGDGAGISLQLCHNFAREIFSELPAQRDTYAIGMLFLKPHRVAELQKFVADCIAEDTQLDGLELLGWRAVPIVASVLGEMASSAMPAIYQLAVHFTPISDWRIRDAQIYFLRRQIELAAQRHGFSLEDLYFCSFSSSLIVYKGMFTAPQLEDFYPDLKNQLLCSAYALVHQRYSTNTLPQWHLAHPYRHVAHNGEINTIEHNRHSFAILESNFDSPVFEKRVHELAPTLDSGSSDSASFDAALESLLHNGRSLPHALSMMVPEPFGSGTDLPPEVKDYYHYHSMLMAPWDGPAAIVATTGHEVTAILDRNGLRPARFTITKDGRLILASEAGVLQLAAANIAQQGKLSPGKLLSLDLERGKLLFDRELKNTLAAKQPYGQWLAHKIAGLQQPNDNVSASLLAARPITDKSSQRQLAAELYYFRYNYEDLRDILAPMAEDSTEPTGSMASPLALAALVRGREPHTSAAFSYYFRQIFAQVTNPPIDPYRETAVMSLRGYLGPQGNLLHKGAPFSPLLQLEHPIFGPNDLQKLETYGKEQTLFAVRRLSLLLDSRALDTGKTSGTILKQALTDIASKAEEQARAAAHSGACILLLSDLGVDRHHAAIPALLALGAVQQRLVHCKLRHLVSLGVESGESFSVHHFGTLMAYGANFILPYMAYSALEELQRRHLSPAEELDKVVQNYIEASKKGLLKVMSKMGVSTMQSYQNSQLYEILGLSSEIVAMCFPGTANPIEGKDFAAIERELQLLHYSAWQTQGPASNSLQFNGSQRLRRRLKLQNIPVALTQPQQQNAEQTQDDDDENQLLTPMSIVYLQQAVRHNDYQSFGSYCTEVNRAGKCGTIRGMLRLRSDREAIDLAQVEETQAILRRFVSGAMSYGSLSKEAHEAIAIAMNRLGARSNSGEGGEDPARYKLLPNGDDRRSRIKQIASGRFGVNSYYLANADELQIKMAQGAKPGEGGQLPGKKVDAEIARVRNSTPGVTLISPPPHHDIYSIEDLAQLIYDLRAANPVASISVKLVAKGGVGTVAAGVAKGKANSILIAGHDGGTGASPLSSLMHAGSYWELGLAETQQSLRRNHLRERVRLQCDGQLKTGRDVLIAALLGADEFGFGTSCLVALGCIMMRKCHTNSCPVGITTQDKRCRARFAGRPEHVENMMRFIAADLRQLMAQMGYSSLDQLIGRADLLEPDLQNPVLQTNNINLQPLLDSVANAADRHLPRHYQHPPDLHDHYSIEAKLLRLCRAALGTNFEQPKTFYHEAAINNSCRAVGTTISYHISKHWGAAGLPDKSIHLKFKGSAGQSFGAFAAHGLQLELEGESNDYFGKGLSGARLLLYPPAALRPEHKYQADELGPQESGIIAGNVCLFGATSGSAYIAGRAGERFAVRNSGATAVVEGLGAHGCEYMTGGRVIVLGRTGLNFAAGMSGGIAYVWDLDGKFSSRCNTQQVELDDLAEYPSERVWLAQQLKNHWHYTNSSLARQLLDNWPHSQFIRVMPLEYKSSLQQIAARQRLPQTA